MPDLSGKVALVTGASRGIGAAIAMRLAADGAAVAVNFAGSIAAAHAVVESITSAGGRAVALQGDVGDAATAARLVDATIADLGGLDIIVNNAGITRDGLIMRMTDENWDDVVRTNLTGVFNVTRAAAKHLAKQRSGSIINITSVVGLVGNAGQVNYSAAKAGVIGLTKSVARELAGRGVRANAIAPGFIETDMTAGLPEAARESALGAIAMKRFGAPGDIAASVAFLASDDAAYITGQVLAVDGGMTYC
jgi:3-oxoacyl-[acyl-carrier protein] reductase